MRRKLLGILALLLAAVMIYSGYQIWKIQSEYREGTQTYEDLNRYIKVPDRTAAPSGTAAAKTAAAVTPRPSAAQADSYGDPDRTPKPRELYEANLESCPFVFPEVDFASLLEVSDEVVGWIYVPGTDISYPVAQGKDNKYYLERMLNGRYNGAGTIFMDYRNDPRIIDSNTVLYGHHMLNGSMFAQLVSFKKQAFLDEHKYFQFITPTMSFQMDIAAVFVADPVRDTTPWDISFRSDAETQEWIEKMVGRSLVETGYTYTPGDQFMTLSTCSYEFDEARTLVIGVMRWE